MPQKLCGIYKIANTFNGKVYIGQSVDIRERFYEHKRKLRLQQHFNKYLQNAYNKYGEYFEYEVIEECNLGELDRREMYWIGFYHSDDKQFGYNIMAGGQLNRSCAVRTKKLISKPVFCIETGVVYPSVKEAERATCVRNISLACNGKIRHAGGLHWCFKEDATQQTIENILNRPRKLPSKKVVCVETGEVFDSMTEASNAYGVSVATISTSCNQQCNQHRKRNYHWMFYEEVGA